MVQRGEAGGEGGVRHACAIARKGSSTVAAQM